MDNLLQTLMGRAGTNLWSPSQETLDANTKQVNDAAPYQQEPSLDPNMMLKLLSNQTSPMAIGANIMGAGAGLLGKLRGGLGAAESAAPAIGKTLGEVAPEFAPVGGEAALNAGRMVAPKALNPISEAAFSKYTAKPANSVFDGFRKAGTFSGDRTLRGVGNLQQEAPGGLSEALQKLMQRGQ